MQEKETISVNGKEIKATKTHRSIADVAWKLINILNYSLLYTS